MDSATSHASAHGQKQQRYWGPLTEGGQRHVTCVRPTLHMSAHGQRRWHGGPLTEGGRCHVTCVRPRSEAAVLGTSDRGRTAPRHMRPPHITRVRPRSEAVAWGTSDRGRTVVARVRPVPRHLSTRLKSKKRTCSLCDTPFWDTHTQTVTLLSTPTPPVEFWYTHRQIWDLSLIHI